MKQWEAFFNSEQSQLASHMFHSNPGRLPGRESHLLSSHPSLLCPLPAPHSRSSGQPKSFLESQDLLGFLPLAEKAIFFSFLYQPATGPGQELLAPSVSASSEKADGVMVTAVLDVSL